VNDRYPFQKIFTFRLLHLFPGDFLVIFLGHLYWWKSLMQCTTQMWLCTVDFSHIWTGGGGQGSYRKWQSYLGIFCIAASYRYPGSAQDCCVGLVAFFTKFEQIIWIISLGQNLRCPLGWMVGLNGGFLLSGIVWAIKCLTSSGRILDTGILLSRSPSADKIVSSAVLPWGLQRNFSPLSGGAPTKYDKIGFTC
jgi:hypothetical protein